MKQDHRRDFFYLALAVLLLMILTACGARVDQTVTFYDDQSWAAEILITLPREVVALAGTTTQIDAEIAGLVREMEQAGARVSYEAREDEGLITYVMDAEGSGLDILQQIAFEDADIQMRSVDGKQQIAFAMFVPYDFAGGTITLIGDEIVSSNGRVIEDGKVQWTNSSGLIEAVIVPKSRFGAASLLVRVAAVAGIVGLAAAGLYLARRRSKQSIQGPEEPAPLPQGRIFQPQEAIGHPQPAASQPQDMVGRFCGHCGAPLSNEARFCPTCGQASK